MRHFLYETCASINNNNKIFYYKREVFFNAMNE